MDRRRNVRRRGEIAQLKLVVTESVEGYLDHQRKEWAIPSSGVPLRIREPWFDGDSGEPWQVRHQVADALKAHLAHRRSVALADISTAVDNVFVQTSKGYLLSNNSVLVYDNVCGGLGLTVKGGGKLGQRGAECQSVNSSTWSNLPPPITHAGATGESKSLALGSLPVFIVLDSAEGTN